MAGTSQATPHVAGVAALLVSLGLRGQAAPSGSSTARDAGFPALTRSTARESSTPAPRSPGLARPGGGSAGAGPGPIGAGSAARISLARVLRIRSVLRRGIRVRCTSAGAGRCRVSAYAGRRRIAAGSRIVRAGVPVTVAAPVTRRGRALLLAALRRRRTVRLSVRVALPGVRVQRRTLRLRP